MKFSLIEDFEEQFTSPKNKDTHYTKRQNQNQYTDITKDEYEAIADKLSKTPIDNKRVFGYMSITKEGKTAYCKYDKQTEDFVVYTIKDSIPYTITMYKKSWRQYNSEKSISYFDEISE